MQFESILIPIDHSKSGKKEAEPIQHADISSMFESFDIGKNNYPKLKGNSYYNPYQVKHRKRTSKEQLRMLEESFQQNQKPGAETRRTLATSLGMTPRSVQIWFQNRRAKLKPKKAKQSEDSKQENIPPESVQDSQCAEEALPVVKNSRSKSCPMVLEALSQEEREILEEQEKKEKKKEIAKMESMMEILDFSPPGETNNGRRRSVSKTSNIYKEDSIKPVILNPCISQGIKQLRDSIIANNCNTPQSSPFYEDLKGKSLPRQQPLTHFESLSNQLCLNPRNGLAGFPMTPMQTPNFETIYKSDQTVVVYALGESNDQLLASFIDFGKKSDEEDDEEKYKTLPQIANDVSGDQALSFLQAFTSSNIGNVALESEIVVDGNQLKLNHQDDFNLEFIEALHERGVEDFSYDNFDPYLYSS